MKGFLEVSACDSCSCSYDSCFCDGGHLQQEPQEPQEPQAQEPQAQEPQAQEPQPHYDSEARH